MLVGSDKPRDRREKLAALQAVPQEEEVVIVATGRYIGEGFDVPRLDTLLFGNAHLLEGDADPVCGSAPPKL